MSDAKLTLRMVVLAAAILVWCGLSLYASFWLAFFCCRDGFWWDLTNMIEVAGFLALVGLGMWWLRPYFFELRR
jgi:hypothetical protein